MKKPILFGKYLLLERINVGGMAEVFIAKHFGLEGFEKILAIKKILPTMAEDEEFITMFGDEARISVQLNHANIAHILDFGKSEDNYFIAMEYVAGRDLRAILERSRRRKEIMPTAQAVFIASKMCEGLEYAHRKKDARGYDLHIIHRDVSPQNVLVSYEGEVKLIDFGIAKATNRNQKTQAGILKGKFGYMSPEQVRGFVIDRRSDLFAVGVILYEMLTGEKLFVGESDFSTLEKVRNADVPLPTQFNPKIPAGLEKVVLKALAREPDDRYQWASDLQEDLMRFQLAGDQIYTSKHLAGYMKTVFAEDLLREAERMERFAAIEKPEQLEGSGVRGIPARPMARRMSSEGETPAGGARPPPGAAAASVLPSRALEFPRQAVPPKTPKNLRKPIRPAAVEGTHVGEDAKRRPDVPTQTAGASSAAKGAPAEQVPPTFTPFAKNGQALERNEDAGQATHPADSAAPAGAGRQASPGRDAAEARGAIPRRMPLARNADRAAPPDAASERALHPVTGQKRKTAIIAGASLLASLGVIAAIVLSAKGEAQVVVTVTPTEGAAISVNGTPASAGQRLDLEPGSYEIEASAPGRNAERRVVTLAEGENAPVHFELGPKTPATADAPQAASGRPKAAGTFTARFVTTEPSVEIHIGDDLVGVTPDAVAPNLEVGKTYRFIARKDGFKPHEGEFVAASPGELDVAIPVLEKAPRPEAAQGEGEAVKRAVGTPVRRRGATGWLACSTRPAGAEVFVDGRPTGRLTPVALGNPVVVPAGNRVIQFKMEGKKSALRTVEIKEGEVARLVNVPLE